MCCVVEVVIGLFLVDSMLPTTSFAGSASSKLRSGPTTQTMLFLSMMVDWLIRDQRLIVLR